MKSLLALSITCLGLACASTTALAQKTWKVGSAAQPGTVLLKHVEEFGQNVAANTKGEIKVERLFIGSEQEIVQQIVRGRLEMVSVSLADTAPIVPRSGAATRNAPSSPTTMLCRCSRRSTKPRAW